MRLHVAVPVCRDIKAGAVSSLAALTHKLTATGLNGKPLEALSLKIMQGVSLLPRGRQMALDDALLNGFTHILMIDDDMVYTPEVIDMIASRNLDFVACNYQRKLENGGWIAMGKDGCYINSDSGQGVEEAAWVGLGLALVKTEPLLKVSKPHFEVRWIPEKQDYLGEDMFFCHKVREAGIKIHIDHDASRLVQHVGDFNYGFRM